MCYFSDGIRNAENATTMNTRGPRNLLAMLPEEFTLEDATRVRRQRGMDTKQTMHMISVWMNRGYVSQISDLSFKNGYKEKYGTGKY